MSLGSSRTDFRRPSKVAVKWLRKPAWPQIALVRVVVKPTEADHLTDRPVSGQLQVDDADPCGENAAGDGREVEPITNGQAQRVEEAIGDQAFPATGVDQTGDEPRAPGADNPYHDDRLVDELRAYLARQGVDLAAAVSKSHPYPPPATRPIGA